MSTMFEPGQDPRFAHTVPSAAPSSTRPMPLAASTTERNWAVGAHLSGFIAAWLALGFLGPLTVLLVAGNSSAYVRRHAIEAVNFNLSVLIYAAVSTALLFVLVGFLLLPLVGLLYAVASVLGAVAASRGAEFRYPLSIRFLKA
ncbi:MAG: DUF4870 domain-containing protein [Kineosporiaceae bacterium]